VLVCKEEVMKQYLFIIFLNILLPGCIFGQKTVDAKDIIAKLNTGDPVRYENVTIRGELDFTSVKDRERVEVKNSDGYEIHCHIPQDISFSNCIFTADVTGYREGFYPKAPAFAVFHGKVECKECEIKGQWAFRHSVFKKAADFTGTVFFQDPTFRHVRFLRKADFENTEFREAADFRHTSFRSEANFRAAVFKGRADFRHCTVLGKSNFNDADFQRSADFKHASIRNRYLEEFITGKW